MRESTKAGIADPAVAERLKAGIDALGLALPDEAADRLLAYLELLGRWNRVFNLTAVREVQDMVTRHLLDSLAVLPYLPPGALIDVGSGAGLPGIPIAIADPSRPVTLLDRSHKRVGFLTEATARLGLKQVVPVCGRAEEHQPPRPYDIVVTRAFASLADTLAQTRHLLADQGVALAMKGALPTEEMAQIKGDITIRAVHPLTVPGLNARRHLIVMARAA
ncbi:MAG: 16S rRNA (guanine(527)-N(7))-methyltransferase RsmG [Gammaproteobacteria bacterium]|nr:16S rRNA (guanine(527)-N(7))-methyltransferase RsmG [Gammaproteobacteria bacterium]